MTKPTVSVLLPVYNAEQFLSEAIESILNQTYQDFEFIIINDGSSDASGKIITAYANLDKRIKVVNQTNHGLVFSLNKGIRLAQGKYIARMDADDISLPKRLEKQMDYLTSHPETSLLGTSFVAIDERGKDLYVFKTIASPIAVKLDMIVRNPFGHGTVIFNKEVIKKLGCYSNISYTEDYDLWARVAQMHVVANISEPLYKWRHVESSMSHSKHLENQKIIVELKQRIWKQNLPINKIKTNIDKTLLTLKTFNKEDTILTVNLLVALYFYLIAKGLKEPAAHIRRNLLKTSPLLAISAIKKAKKTKLIEGYDIKRIQSDAKGEVYD